MPCVCGMTGQHTTQGSAVLCCGHRKVVLVVAVLCVLHRGFATNGELAYGPKGKKSSANAAKVESMNDMHTEMVACGVGFTLFLVDSKAPQVRVCGSSLCMTKQI